SKPVKPSSPVSPPSEAAGESSLAALFRQQMAVLEANVAIIRQQNELLARGGAGEVPAPVARFEVPAESLPELVVPVGNGNGNGNGNGHGVRAEANGNGHGAPARAKSNGGAPALV